MAMRTESRERDGQKRKETERWKQGKWRVAPFPSLLSFLPYFIPSFLPPAKSICLASGMMLGTLGNTAVMVPVLDACPLPLSGKRIKC